MEIGPSTPEMDLEKIVHFKNTAKKDEQTCCQTENIRQGRRE